MSRPELIAGPRLAEPAYRNQHFNLLIGTTFPHQPKALWLTRARPQPEDSLRGVGHHTVAAIALGAVERLVGPLEQGLRTILGGAERRNADRDGDIDRGRALVD